MYRPSGTSHELTLGTWLATDRVTRARLPWIAFVVLESVAPKGIRETPRKGDTDVPRWSIGLRIWSVVSINWSSSDNREWTSVIGVWLVNLNVERPSIDKEKYNKTERKLSRLIGYSLYKISLAILYDRWVFCSYFRLVSSARTFSSTYKYIY